VKDPRVYLAQILERIERIVSYTAQGRAAFLAESLIQDAVISSARLRATTKRAPMSMRGECRKRRSPPDWLGGMEPKAKPEAAWARLRICDLGRLMSWRGRDSPRDRDVSSHASLTMAR
jgi:hypothetical protein